ncbi:TylF/MycF/NovP-related O-methyltransferase [uncultured Paludibaculum sp.]|uniref:TylF/MycF/NovP-related O-methyltransferase n=1 Tax=uncultured Paludibaculum sp. TaxID=1765020 RepID=UPI002AAAA481|nr:TylF/MycF/NovP-related O-methyltransferase [uncultured Paludibaculum sp.]
METLYLDLLKKCLLGETSWENEARILYLRDCAQGTRTYDCDTELHLEQRLPEFCRQFRELSRIGRFVDDRVENLGYQPTMVGRLRLENVEDCLNCILRDSIPGDLMECGVWQGGVTIFMRGFLRARGITDRLVWVADSFAGIPASRLPQDLDEDLSAARFPNLAVPLERVKSLFVRYDLLDAQVRFLEGLFRDTLPCAPIGTLALLRIDADLYESTRDVLEALYSKVSPGGFVIVDDYGCIPACRQAVDEFLALRGLTPTIHQVDWTGVYWQKE